MNINKLLTPYNYTKGNIDRIQWIVIHYVGATGGARANCNYYASGNLNASAHYFVDFDGSIWQSVEDKNIAWSVGGSKYANTKGGKYYGICKNANSLNIEMCVRKKGDWYFEQETVWGAIALTKELMDKYGIDSDHVIRHYDVTGKICPEPYVDDTAMWNQFKAAISEAPKKSGWYEEDGGWRFYLGNTGEPVRNDWYYHTNGRYTWSDGAGHAIHDTWYEYQGKQYYFAGDCYMCSSQWVDWKGKSYYVTADGSMAVNAYIKSKDPSNANIYYWVGSDGVYMPEYDTKTPDLSKYTLAI